jgi:uncharacterized membrane-anchored protein YhcB (DUF1043 family)
MTWLVIGFAFFVGGAMGMLVMALAAAAHEGAVEEERR